MTASWQINFIYLHNCPMSNLFPTANAISNIWHFYHSSINPFSYLTQNPPSILLSRFLTKNPHNKLPGNPTNIFRVCLGHTNVVKGTFIPHFCDMCLCTRYNVFMPTMGVIIDPLKQLLRLILEDHPFCAVGWTLIAPGTNTAWVWPKNTAQIPKPNCEFKAASPTGWVDNKTAP